MMIFAVSFFSAMLGIILFMMVTEIREKCKKRKEQARNLQEKFYSISEYYERMEKVNLEILEAHPPVDRTIILWCGLNGLRLNEDGTAEWISRKKQNPAQNPLLHYMNMCQSPQAAISELQRQMAACYCNSIRR